MLCAHYDTKEDTPGAWDNASGVAVLLSLAERFAGMPHDSWPELEFTAFTQEEYYTSPNEDPYYQANHDKFGEITAAINIDGAGHILSTSSLAIFEASPGMEELVRDAQSHYPAFTKVDPWPASCHYLFFSNGVPSLAFSAVGPSHVIHTPRDSADWVSAYKLAEQVSLIGEIVESLVDKDPAWTRRVKE